MTLPSQESARRIRWVFETSLRENSLLENAFVGQLVGQPKKTPQLTAEELSKLKRLLNSL